VLSSRDARGAERRGDVTYRVAPPRISEPPSGREEVVEIARLGFVWTWGLGALAAFALVGAPLAFARVGIECERRAPGERGTCALVTTRPIGAEVEPIGAVEAQVAMLSGGTREYLGVHRAKGGIRWFDLHARNAVVVAAHHAFVGGSALRATIPLEDEVAMSLGLAALGVALGVGLALGQRRVRIAVDAETGALTIAARGLAGGASEETIATEGFERVTTEPQSDSELERVVVHLGDRRRTVAVATSGSAESAARRLDAILGRLWKAKRAAAEAAEREDREQREELARRIRDEKARHGRARE
jgi:hypothetical protein